MNKQIWKFELSKEDKQQIAMPQGAQILSCQEQRGGKWCIWALVIPEAEKEERTFEVFGTGHPISYDMGVDREFIDTIQTQGAELSMYVFHIFERLN